MQSKVTYELSKNDLEQVLADQLQNLSKERVLNRFRDRLVSVKCVAEIHGVARDTVLKYANANLIPHERKGKLLKFSLAEVLEIDFHHLRTIRR